MQKATLVIKYTPTRIIKALEQVREEEWQELVGQNEGKTRTELIELELVPSTEIPDQYELQINTEDGNSHSEILSAGQYSMLSDFILTHRDEFYYDENIRKLEFGGSNWDDAPTKAPIMDGATPVIIPIHSAKFQYSFKTGTFFIVLKPVVPADPYVDKFENLGEFTANYKMITTHLDELNYIYAEERVAMGISS
jgi:hypothetical protein